MGKVVKIDGTHLTFWCPGCCEEHKIPIDGSRGWQWNGSLELPVINPSISRKGGHYCDHHSGDCWCTYEARFGEPPPFVCSICHSFIGTSGAPPGHIIFLSDCTHSLAGQTLPLSKVVDWPR